MHPLRTFPALAALGTGLSAVPGGMAAFAQTAPEPVPGTPPAAPETEPPAPEAPAAPETAPGATPPAATEPAPAAPEAAPVPEVVPASPLPEAVPEVAFQPADLPVIGRPVDGLMGFQPPATELARDISSLDHMLLIIIGIITVFVTALLLYAAFRYSRSRNPVPATFTHNSPLEIAWTIVPIVILVFIGAFSLPVLFKQMEIPQAEVTIKATGFQWYWGYEYVDEDVAFDSFMLGSPATGGDNKLTPEVEAQLAEYGYAREDFLLATDTAMVIPVNRTVVVQVTGADVIHAWTVPAFGVKQDAVPGRLAELWFRAEQEGVYFGQCSELCGIAHAYMPITVKVVSDEAYAAWLDSARAGEYELSTLHLAATARAAN